METTNIGGSSIYVEQDFELNSERIPRNLLRGASIPVIPYVVSRIYLSSIAQSDPSNSSATNFSQPLQRCAPLKTGLPHEEQ